jgi:hypothetical protein
MAVFCISYDLKSGNYEPLIEAIKTYGLWWHQSESTWFIETTHNSREVLDSLRTHLKTEDKLIVIQVQKNWWALGHTEKEYEWMKNRNF